MAGPAVAATPESRETPRGPVQARSRATRLRRLDAAIGGMALGALVLPEPDAEARSFAWLEEGVGREIGDV